MAGTNERFDRVKIRVLEFFQLIAPNGTAAKVMGVDSNGNPVLDSAIAGGAALNDGDYGDVTVSEEGTVITINDDAVTTDKIADEAVTLGKLQHIGQHKLMGRHDTGDGIPHQIGVNNGIEFNGQNIGIAANGVTNTMLADDAVDSDQVVDSAITQAKLSATGAAAGKVLQTDGTNYSWETPSGGGGSDIGSLNMAFEQTASGDSNRYSEGFVDRMATDRIDYAFINASVLIHNTLHPDFQPFSNNAGANTYTRYGILYNGTNYFFPGYNTRMVMGIQKTADFATFSHDDQEVLNAFAGSHQSGAIWTDISTNAFAIALLNSGTASFIGFLVNDAGVWSDFIKPPLVSGKYLTPTPSANANIVYQNGVLSAYFSFNTSRYWTDDYGVTWTQCTNGFNDRPVHRMANGTLYAYTGNSFKFSTDNGKTWTDGTTLPATPSTDKANHCIDFNSTNYVFVADGTNTVWTATSLTGSWTSRTSAFSTSNPKHVYWCGDLFVALSTASQTNYAMTSADGVTWVQRTGANATAMRVACKTGNYYVVSGTGRTETTNVIGTNFASIVAAGCGLHDNSFFINKQTNKLAFSSTDGNAVYFYDGTTNGLITITSSQQNTEYALGLALPTNTKIKWR